MSISWNLEEFMAQEHANQWFNLKRFKLEIYLRVTKRENLRCFDIANIISSNRRQGNYSIFLNYVLGELPKHHFHLIFVENILDEWFADFHIRQGFKIVEHLTVPQSRVWCVQKYI